MYIFLADWILLLLLSVTIPFVYNGADIDGMVGNRCSL